MPDAPRHADWMAALAAHYDDARQRYPGERLLVMFDIDGTITDIRAMILDVLRQYDRAHQTEHFRHLTLGDITVSDNRIEGLLNSLPIPAPQHAQIADWFSANRWTPEAIYRSHRPYHGVLEVIRWFQLQPNTFVGLNTGRPEAVREMTLRSLNALGDIYRVSFPNELLFMNPGGWGGDVLASKVAGVRYFQAAGYRVIAFVDNEPENLAAIEAADPDHEILLLHADTIFDSRRERMPSQAIGGDSYALTSLLEKGEIPGKIQLVWHAVNSARRIEEFLQARVHWGEFDVRRDPFSGALVTRQYSYTAVPPVSREETAPLLSDTLERLKKAGKGVKLDLRAGLETVDEVLALTRAAGFDGTGLWFNGRIERLLEDGFHKLSVAYPAAILQCSIDFLAPLILGTPAKAKEILDMLTGWGLNRFSVRWQTLNKRQIIRQMEGWGLEVNIFEIPNLEQFLKATLLLPRSITADFIHPGLQEPPAAP